MKTISQYLLLPLLMSLTAFSATGDDSNPAALAFEQMKTLVGYWKRQDANNTKFKIHFEGTSINCLWPLAYRRVQDQDIILKACWLHV